jgi:hypothetical protein
MDPDGLALVAGGAMTSACLEERASSMRKALKRKGPDESGPFQRERNAGHERKDGRANE